VPGEAARHREPSERLESLRNRVVDLQQAQSRESVINVRWN
jgi:hypothetical protein